MPIRLLLEHDHAFTPEDMKVLIEAFEETLRALNLVDREDRLTMTVAKLIIEFAKEGERDPNRLRELVMKTLQPE
jgi:tRNA C32,U32 (ribose-2'-O)-methylase TrmJ